jgi:hypothetical protein
MKRSEMVERLKDFFVDEDWCNEADDAFATEIIDFLISQGMLPPAYESYKKIPASFMFEDVYRKIYVNEWEPEDKQ